MKVLITGVSGFVGTFLSERLLREGYEVVGLSRSRPENKEIKFFSCDINDALNIGKILKETKPDEIYHLAGTAFIPHCYGNPVHAYHTIMNGTMTLYEEVRKQKLEPKILYVGSGEVYGEWNGHPFHEGDLLHPNNPYAGAKSCADLLSEQYVRSYKMNIIRARPFNHTGPKQSEKFVCSNFAKQIAEMEIDHRQVIRTGNIFVKRDFLDVRDVVNAYYLLMQKGEAGEVYNVSANKAVSIRKVLHYLFQYSDIQSPKVEVDLNKVRDNEAIVRIGDNTKLCQETGWRPIYKLKDTMGELLQYWRKMQHYRK
ncbi:GDP-mannose 4,6-dehydratase [Paenibacillus popilliae]|uniref:GDP-mannose 4,6-dehydratase n=1 Tax=Paenibacillus popilliae TaxID=78057 RepID=UPI0002D5AB99|nr:GDP-mannose 4,6-dehydratase [Paenibacillus popilliae]